MAMHLDPKKDHAAYDAVRAQWLAHHPGEGVPCPKCGAENLPGEDLCADCGYLLAAPSPDAPQGPETHEPPRDTFVPSAHSETLPRAAKNGGVSGPPRKFLWGWVAIGIAAAVAAAGTGIDLYLGQVQHLGQAEQQLQRDARALGHHASTPPAKSPATPSPSSAPKSNTAPLPAQIPAAVRGYQDIIEGRLATFGHYIEFPATLTGPAGRRTVTVMVDTGNGNDDAVTPAAAQQLGLRVIGHGMVGGVVGTTQSAPIYAGFSLVPQGHYAAGQPGPLAIPKVIAMPNTVGGADVNIGQATLAQNAQIAENNGVFWFGWNPSGSVNPQPSATPPSSAPSPSAAPPALWHTMTPEVTGDQVCMPPDNPPPYEILTNTAGQRWKIPESKTGYTTLRWQGVLSTIAYYCNGQLDTTVHYAGNL